MSRRAKYDPATAHLRIVPSESRLDPQGRPICVWCDKRLRLRSWGYGFEGAGLFCNMAHAAEWAQLKASAGSDGP